MTKRLYDVLKDCNKEEEVKSEFCKFFKMKINALKSIDHYTPTILFEFKYDRNFKNSGVVAHVIAQTMYYARLLKFSLTKCALPPYICVVDKNEAFFVETRVFSKFYSSQTSRYDWDRAPSTPCPKLVEDIATALADEIGLTKSAIRSPHVYDLTKPAEDEQFVTKCREYLLAQMSFIDLLDKKSITEDNFLDVFEYWDSLFGKYVKNGRKSSEYFLADIEQGKSMKGENGQVLFNVDGSSFVPKTLKPKDYAHFWENYEKVDAKAMMQIRQKSDRITEDFRRRFTGEFFTPVEFAAKGLEYLERSIGREWWKTGEYRFWDMAAGTGNLEFNLPSSALPYCYISTLEEDDAKYCKKIFPAATCFQYNYRFLAKWLAGRGGRAGRASLPESDVVGRAARPAPPLSPEAQAVMSAAKSLYRKFYAEISNTNWMDAKIETWDVGYYQVCKTLKEVGLAADEFAALKTAHDALRKKLLPKVYEYGFLNPDVEYFQ